MTEEKHSESNRTDDELTEFENCGRFTELSMVRIEGKRDDLKGRACLADRVSGDLIDHGQRRNVHSTCLFPRLWFWRQYGFGVFPDLFL